MIKLTLVLILLALSGCGSHLTSYDVKANVGQTTDDNGTRSFYTGGGVSAHFDVK